MGDVSNEPSMEDILSSIKRIIAEEGDAATSRGTRRPPRAAAVEPPAVEEEVLELSEPVVAEPPLPAPPAIEEPVIEPLPKSPESILSAMTAEATRGPLEQLSRMVVKPDVAGSDTLEGLVRDMLRPMLREWLDANLPRMVEEMVQREITRITSRG